MNKPNARKRLQAGYPDTEQSNKIYSQPESENDYKISYIEVPISTVNQTNIKFPDQPQLYGKKILAIECSCQAAYTAGNPANPSNLIGIPKGQVSGNPNINYTDLTNAFLKLNDQSNTAILDTIYLSDYVPSINNGIIRYFKNPAVGIVWQQSLLIIPPAYNWSAANIVAMIWVHYED